MGNSHSQSRMGIPHSPNGNFPFGEWEIPIRRMGNFHSAMGWRRLPFNRPSEWEFPIREWEIPIRRMGISHSRLRMEWESFPEIWFSQFPFSIDCGIPIRRMEIPHSPNGNSPFGEWKVPFAIENGNSHSPNGNQRSANGNSIES